MLSQPPKLSNFENGLELVNLLKELSDASARKRIEDDIKSFHALNDTEAKKAQEARDLIKQHSGILEETRKSSEQNTKDRKALDQERISFKAEMEAERAKLAISKGEVSDAMEKANNLHITATGMINTVNAKENDLRTAKAEHEASVKALEADKLALKKQRQDIDEYKKQIIALDEETKAKVAKLKQFNF